MRPAILSADSAARLAEYRRFRHIVRNVYTSRLLPERMESLVLGLPTLWATVSDELLAFAAFLMAAGR